MNKFKQKNYFVIKKAISKEFAEFIYNYLILKSNVVDNLFKDKYHIDRLLKNIKALHRL